MHNRMKVQEMFKKIRCNHGDGVTVKIAGVPVDPCIYEEVEAYRNVTVRVLRCKRCGHIEVEWERQENTGEITDG